MSAQGAVALQLLTGGPKAKTASPRKPFGTPKKQFRDLPPTIQLIIKKIDREIEPRQTQADRRWLSDAVRLTDKQLAEIKAYKERIDTLVKLKTLLSQCAVMHVERSVPTVRLKDGSILQVLRSRENTKYQRVESGASASNWEVTIAEKNKSVAKCYVIDSTKKGEFAVVSVRTLSTGTDITVAHFVLNHPEDDLLKSYVPKIQLH